MNQVIPVILINFLIAFLTVFWRDLFFSHKRLLSEALALLKALCFLEISFLMSGVTHAFALEGVVVLGIAASIQQKNASTKAFQVLSTSFSVIILSQSV